jgi:lipoprotein-anchoring transpeptidase ErfK/SrfK
MRLVLPLIMAAGLAATLSASPDALESFSAVRRPGFVEAHARLPGGRHVETNAVVIVVSVAEQGLAVIRDGVVVHAYHVSTAKAGIGSRPNSDKTPLGWHRVTEWIGGNAIAGQVFVSRQPVSGEILTPGQWRSNDGRDYVLTRILWLDGLEYGKNRGPGADSHSRFIYIHGTNQEHLLGQPASHGCIRLSNHDVMVVYALTEGRPTYVEIIEGPF